MEKQKLTFFSAKNLTLFSVLLALTIVLQCFAGTIKIGPTAISLTLVPIVLGATMLGIWAGAFLGLVFGFIVLMFGVSGADAFTSLLLTEHPAITVILCLVKGTAAGAVSGILYKLVSKKSKYVAVFVAAAAAPVVNTGLFILGALCMSGFFGPIAEGEGYANVFYYLVLGVAGWNFLLEFAINILLSPAIYTVERVFEKQMVTKKKARAAVTVGETLDNQTEAIDKIQTDETPNGNMGE